MQKCLLSFNFETKSIFKDLKNNYELIEELFKTKILES